jgi:hypothetical protein
MSLDGVDFLGQGDSVYIDLPTNISGLAVSLGRNNPPARLVDSVVDLRGADCPENRTVLLGFVG